MQHLLSIQKLPLLKRLLWGRKSEATSSGCPNVSVSNVTWKHYVPPQGSTLIGPLSDHIHPPDSDSFWNASLAQNTFISLMLSNIGNKPFPCQQFRAPSQAVTVQSISFGYGYTDSLSLWKTSSSLEKVHTKSTTDTQKCEGWLKRMSSYVGYIQKRPKVSPRNYTVFEISFLMLQ